MLSTRYLGVCGRRSFYFEERIVADIAETIRRQVSAEYNVEKG